MIDAELLKILCCPETRQSLTLADSALVDSLNQKISRGELKNRAAKSVAEKLDAALLRADGKVLYPIRHSIPVMLIDEAIGVAT